MKLCTCGASGLEHAPVAPDFTTERVVPVSVGRPVGNSKAQTGDPCKTADQVTQRWIIRKCYLALIPFLFIAGWLAYLDRSSVSFGALQFKADLHLSSSDYGLGSALFYIGYGVFQIPSNIVIMGIGAPSWLSVLLGSWGLISLCTAFMRNRSHFFVVRFLLGAIEAGYFPGAWYYMSQFFTSTELAFAYGTMTTCTALGQMLGAPIAAGILFMDGLRGLRGWQWIFLIEGSGTVAFAAVLVLCLPRVPNTAWFLKERERAWLGKRQQRIHAAAQEEDPDAGGWHNLVTNWRLWYLAFSFLLVQFSVATIVYFNPLIVEAMFNGGWGTTVKRSFANSRESVLYEARIALISAILWLAVAGAMILNGASVKRFHQRNLHCAIPLAIAGVSYMLVPTALSRSGPIAGYAVLILGAASVESIYGPVLSWPKTFLYGHSSALSIAFINSIASIGGFAGPFVMGKLSGLKGGYSTAMFVMGSVNLFNALLLFCFRPGNIERLNIMASLPPADPADVKGFESPAEKTKPPGQQMV